MFSQSGSYSLIVSYIEAQLKKIPLGWVDAFTIDLYPEDVRKTFAGASLSNSERQEEKLAGCNMRVDMYVSETTPMTRS